MRTIERSPTARGGVYCRQVCCKYAKNTHGFKCPRIVAPAGTTKAGLEWWPVFDSVNSKTSASDSKADALVKTLQGADQSQRIHGPNVW